MLRQQQNKGVEKDQSQVGGSWKGTFHRVPSCHVISIMPDILTHLEMTPEFHKHSLTFYRPITPTKIYLHGLEISTNDSTTTYELGTNSAFQDLTGRVKARGLLCSEIGNLLLG